MFIASLPLRVGELLDNKNTAKAVASEAKVGASADANTDKADAKTKTDMVKAEGKADVKAAATK